MDILKLISNLGSSNIEGLLNLVSTFFNKNQTQNTQSNTTQKSQTFDANNPYWSLPTYTQNSIMQSQNDMHSTQKNDKNIDFLEIFKLIAPLLSKKDNTKNQTENTFTTKNTRPSEILKLTKTK
ncbi:MAG: hypothetical protein IJ301_00740 [Clostridia bacterium]|nr:hypothetical protein [Clostridia bacterium]